MKQILIAIAVGSFLGILLGPLYSVFEPIGRAFVMFIQIVILLYIPSSIIHGLGSTRSTAARTLFKKDGAEPGNSFLSYPIKYNVFAFIFFLDRWMKIQDHIGFKKEQYQYWMQGQPPEKKRASLEPYPQCFPPYKLSFLVPYSV